MTAPAQTLSIRLAGERFTLWPHRAALWHGPRERVLFIADTHLGKSQAMRSLGVPVPSGLLDETLGRLTTLVDAACPDRLVVLGDLIDTPAGLTDDLLARVAAWRDAFDRPVALLPGNHDLKRGGTLVEQLGEAWSLDLLDPSGRLGPFALAHDPDAPREDDRLAIAGHLHPAVILGARGDAVKLPCFWYRSYDNALVLPAFSLFTAGAPCDAGRGDGLWPIAGHAVVPFSDPTPPPADQAPAPRTARASPPTSPP